MIQDLEITRAKKFVIPFSEGEDPNINNKFRK